MLVSSASVWLVVIFSRGSFVAKSALRMFYVYFAYFVFVPFCVRCLLGPPHEVQAEVLGYLMAMFCFSVFFVRLYVAKTK